MTHKALLLSLASLLAVLCLPACSSDDDDAATGAGGSSGVAGSAGSAGSSGASGAGGSAGSAGSSCTDPRTETNLVPLQPSQDVWQHLRVDGDELFFVGGEGLSKVSISSGGAPSVVYPAGSFFELSSSEILLVAGSSEVVSVQRATGASSTLVSLPSDQTAVAISTSAVFSHDQSLLDKVGGNLYATPLPGGSPASITTYASLLPPQDFIVFGSNLYFSTTPADQQIKELTRVATTGGSPEIITMPAGLRFFASLGVVNNTLYVAAEDDFFANTILRISADGSIAGSFSMGNRTALSAVPITNGAAIGGIESLYQWPDADPAGSQVKCFLVGAGVSTPYPTIHGWASSGNDVFLSIHTPEPDESNGVYRLSVFP